MKVGILTYHWVSNFGANIQALSTFSYFKNKGYDVYMINWRPYNLEKHYLTQYPSEQNDVHLEFQRLFKLTPICRTSKDVATIINQIGIELVVIGSDAVFTYMPILQRIILTKRGLRIIKPFEDSDFPSPFWADFMEKCQNVKCVAMSASAQNTDYFKIKFPGEKKKIANSLLKMDFVSVRDIWTQKMISYLTNSKIVPSITPDPVFSFNNNVHLLDKSTTIWQKYSLPPDYVLFSVDKKFVSDSWVRELESLFAKENICLIELPLASGKLSTGLNRKICLPLNPLDWYSLIANSSGYIGVLMHPILVSLHNSVPVFSFDTYGFVNKRGFDTTSSKLYHIMNRFQLLNNYYNVKSNIEVPEPSKVYDSIVNFDKDKCKYYAMLLQKEYNEMMEKIINIK